MTRSEFIQAHPELKDVDPGTIDSLYQEYLEQLWLSMDIES